MLIPKSKEKTIAAKRRASGLGSNSSDTYLKDNRRGATAQLAKNGLQQKSNVNFLTDNRSGAVVQQKKKKTIATNRATTIQRITLKQATKAKQDEKLIWYNGDGGYQEVRITNELRAGDDKANIATMSGAQKYVPLTELHLLKPEKHSVPQVGVKGANVPGLSKPIAGENMIHRGIVETEMVNNKPHVRVYSALMGVVDFDSEDAATGTATSKFKDIHQAKNGSITISTGQNSLLWGNMGRPLRTVKWSEKYFAQLIDEKPELKPDYARYTKAISDLDNGASILTGLESELRAYKAELSKKQKMWSSKGKTPTKNQTKSMQRISDKIGGFDLKVRAEKRKMQLNKGIIIAVRRKLGKSANPVIRSFLIPFASFEKISRAALPERLHGVADKVEKLAPTVDLGTTALIEMQGSLRKLSTATIKSAKLEKEIRRLRQQKKKLTRNQGKRLQLRISQNTAIEKTIKELKQSIISELRKYEVGIGKVKEDQTKTKDHNVAYQKAKELHENAYAEVKKLKERALPDLPMGDFTAAGVLAEMKKRNLHKGSINVDVHYEPNQFGLHGEDMDTLRKDAVPNSLKTFAMFPDQLTKKQKEESGELHGVDALKTKLGIPLKNLSKNPWLNGSGFAKKKEFSASANELSSYYATWLKMKKPGFNDEALIHKGNAKIPMKVRIKQLLDFLKENNVDSSRRDVFMEEVVKPWASQSMIAHLMSTGFDEMNDNPTVTAHVPSQDFGKMRADLPLKRSGQ